jgi:hypothetical protein
MSNIVNLFSNFDDLTKKKSIIDNPTDCGNKKKIKIKEYSPSLKQGIKFNKFQNVITKNLEEIADNVSSKEGFDNMNSEDSLTFQTKKVINENNYSSQQQTLNNLKTELQNTITEYETLSSQLENVASEYVNRTNSNNPYFGKVIQFQGGNMSYVTNQGIAKWFPSTTVYNQTVGKNGFPSQGSVVNVNLPWNTSYQSPGTIIPTNPPLLSGTPIQIGQSVGNEGSNIFVNQMISSPVATYLGCYADSSNNPLMTFIDASLNYQQCEQSAINNGYKYFSLQNVDTSSSLGMCYASNDQNKITSLGTSTIVTGQTNLWNSNTSGQTGNTALFQNGSLSVLNSNGAAVFSTPNKTKSPSNYIGCYKDSSNRAMTAYNNGKQSYNNKSCQSAANSIGATYYALQNSKSGQNAQCFTSSNLSQSKQYGLANNCTQIGNGVWSGGGWSNALYQTSTPTNSYFLILQDDGNMCIYLGSSPTDSQGLVWQSRTNGKQQQANPNMIAANNKFGQNWMSDSSVLYPGEYISSTTGTTALVMQTDGNLVLYTYQTGINCSKSNDGNTGGGVLANAIYSLNAVGKQNLMSQLGFVDEDSQLHTYPASNTSYSNTYTQFAGNASGNDIGGASFSSATVANCQTACNSNAECGGFVFDNVNNICYPKTNQMYPNSSIIVDGVNTTYVREKMPTNPPIGVSNSTNNTDSIYYSNYVNGGPVGNNYGLSKITSTQKQKLDQLQTKMNLLSSQINGFTNKFENGTNAAQDQAKKNVAGIKEYLTGIKNSDRKAINFDTTYENILVDSDINVLKQNYNYLFWSVLAAGSLIVTMNVVKNKQ